MTWDQIIFWIVLWWMIWFYLFLGWYKGQMTKGEKSPVTLGEASLMFLLSGFGPILSIMVIFYNILFLNNDRKDKDK